MTFTNQGGAVYSGSDVSFGENSTVTFTGNSVTSYGGAMYATTCKIAFHRHSTVTFSRNLAGDGGGAIRTIFSQTIFTDNTVAMFNSNSATSEGEGGAIWVNVNYFGLFIIRGNLKTWEVNFTGNSQVTFSCTT